MKIYHTSPQLLLLQGDALEAAQSLPTASVDCIVTSPPYYAMRDYDHPQQYGSESTLAGYVLRLTALFRELRRALADDGTLWLNLGDCYNSAASNYQDGGYDGGQHSRMPGRMPLPDPNLPQKNLLGVPWQVAFALRDDGWILRNDIIWFKRNAMPQSVKDRVSSKYEHIFLFSKGTKYHFDLEAIRAKALVNPKGRNPGDVWLLDADIWDMPTQPFPEAHFAVFPPALSRRCILAGCKPEGTVLDPFHGSGTTGTVARELGRNYIGIDLNEEYLEMSLRSPKRLGVTG